MDITAIKTEFFNQLPKAYDSDTAHFYPIPGATSIFTHLASEGHAVAMATAHHNYWKSNLNRE